LTATGIRKEEAREEREDRRERTNDLRKRFLPNSKNFAL
jgi:hypothetical protein